MLTRKIGKLLRGSANTKQIVIACLIGSLLGFTPITLQSTGMILLLLIGFLVFDANLFLTLFSAGIAKAISLPLQGLSFSLGTFLLDGPLQSVFGFLVNAPVTALLGLEYYLLTGGLVVGAVIGVLEALLLIRLLSAFRARMVALEQNSDAFRKWNNKWWVGILKWVFLGSGPKKNYEDMLHEQGRIFRISGIIAGVVLIGTIVGGHFFLGGKLITMGLQHGLERVNGATVDVGSADSSLRKGALNIRKLAAADPEKLNRNLFEADTINIDISGTDLLRKRMTIDRIEVVNGAQGTKRSQKGTRITPEEQPTDAPEQTKKEPTKQEQEQQPLDQYLAHAETWKSRLQQVERFLGSITSSENKAPQSPANRAADYGRASVAARHLIEGSPTLTVRELHAGGVRVQQLEDETIDVDAGNLSSHPQLLKEPAAVRVRSSKETIKLDLLMNKSENKDQAGTMQLILNNLDGNQVGSMLASGKKKPPVQGGTVSVELNGTFQTGKNITVDATMVTHLQNTDLTIGGRTQHVSNFRLPIEIQGPLSSPRIWIDDKLLFDALKKAGADALAGKLNKQVDAQLGKLQKELDNALGDQKGDGTGEDVIDQGKKAIDGLFGGGKDDE